MSYLLPLIQGLTFKRINKQDCHSDRCNSINDILLAMCIGRKPRGVEQENIIFMFNWILRYMFEIHNWSSDMQVGSSATWTTYVAFAERVEETLDCGFSNCWTPLPSHTALEWINTIESFLLQDLAQIFVSLCSFPRKL